MSKKLCISLAIFTLILASSMTAFAAPEVMPDGGMFDAEYYAQNNPDVVAAFGTDKELLYSHYVNCGRAEGRQGFQITADMYTTCPVASQKTLELLATGGTEGVHYVKNRTAKYYRLGDVYGKWGELALKRTDFPDGLIDLDGNGLDDRDPINSLGFVDLNVNGVDDRYIHLPGEERKYIDYAKNYTCDLERWKIDYATLYLCKHGIVCDTSLIPMLCQQCEAVEAIKRIAIEKNYTSADDFGYKVGDVYTTDDGMKFTYRGNDNWISVRGTYWESYVRKGELHFIAINNIRIQ